MFCVGEEPGRLRAACLIYITPGSGRYRTRTDDLLVVNQLL